MLRLFFSGAVLILLSWSIIGCGGGSSSSSGNSSAGIQEMGDKANTITDNAKDIFQPGSFIPFDPGKFGEITVVKGFVIPSDALFLDIRNPWERAKGFAEGSIGGAIYEIRDPANRKDDHLNVHFVDDVLKLVDGDKSRKIILICHSSSRTKKAAKLLSENGFTNVYHIVGGMNAWNSADLPVEIPAIL